MKALQKTGDVREKAPLLKCTEPAALQLEV